MQQPVRFSEPLYEHARFARLQLAVKAPPASGSAAAAIPEVPRMRPEVASDLAALENFAFERALVAKLTSQQQVEAERQRKIEVAAATRKKRARDDGASLGAEAPSTRDAGSSSTWVCSACTVENAGGAQQCGVCETPRRSNSRQALGTGAAPMPPASRAAPAAEADVGSGASPLGNWDCHVCTAMNAAPAARCFACDTLRRTGSTRTGV